MALVALTAMAIAIKIQSYDRLGGTRLVANLGFRRSQVAFQFANPSAAEISDVGTAMRITL